MQELNFLKFSCDPGIIDFSMKYKSFPVLSNDEIQSLKSKIKKNHNFPKNWFSSLGVLIASKMETLDSGI